MSTQTPQPDEPGQPDPTASATEGSTPGGWTPPGYSTGNLPTYQTGNMPAASESEIASMWAATQMAPGEPPEPRDWRVTAGVGVATAVVIAALGFPLGWLWSSIAPWLPVQLSGGAAYYADPEGEQRAAQEGWFIVLSIVAGIVLAIVVFLVLRRFRGSVTIAALGIGSLACGWLAWRFGHNIGRGHALAEVRAGKDGQIIQFPVDLRIKNSGNIAFWHGWLPYIGGDVVYLAVTALLTYIVMVGFSVSPSLGVHRGAVGSEPL